MAPASCFRGSQSSQYTMGQTLALVVPERIHVIFKLRREVAFFLRRGAPPVTIPSSAIAPPHPQ